MEQGFLIDTNILIDAQMNRLPSAGMKFLAEVINEQFIISFISYIEFSGYKNITESTEQFISLANVLEINRTLIHNCIGLRRSHSIKLPDAIIAATAITYKLTLVTRNVNDFKKIQDLSFINPYEL